MGCAHCERAAGPGGTAAGSGPAARSRPAATRGFGTLGPVENTIMTNTAGLLRSGQSAGLGFPGAEPGDET